MSETQEQPKKPNDHPKGQPKRPTLPKDAGVWRDLTAFWILGLCNNYGYVVMLTAAHDIIGQFSEGDLIRSYGRAGKTRECYYTSTGTILLADIIPSLTAKLLMPFLPFHVNLRIAFAVLSSIVSFILVAFASQEWMAFVGVILTSAGAGVGESTLVAYSSSFNKNVVSTWSSGTGGAGVLGSVSYASLISLGMSPRNTMLVMILIPIIESTAFWIILRNPSDVPPISTSYFTIDELAEDVSQVTLKEKVIYIKALLKYMIPLMSVYFCEYFINQGLFELVFFKNIFLDHPAQYRWLNVDYQIGVFISRSSVNCIKFRYIWLMAVFQFLNVCYFLTEVVLFYTPSIWITFAIAFWEGLLGGGAYVNTFYRMSREIPPKKRRYALSIVIQSDSYGILLAGILAIPVHEYICGMPLVVRSVVW